MSQDEAQQLIHKLLLQALARRLPQSKWLSLLHQLVRRIGTANEDDEAQEDSLSLAGSHAAGCLVKHILSQSFIDPLLIEYLQALIYGSANRSGVTPDQGPVTDVITVTLHFLADVRAATSNVPAIEMVSSVIGQGLLMTFQAPVPFRVSTPSFLALLQHLFANSPDNQLETATNQGQRKDTTNPPASLAFIVANLRLLALAADPSISSPQNLLAPRVAITVLINVGQALLAHSIHTLSTAQSTKDHKLKPDDALLRQTRSMSKTCVSEIEAVLRSMNPAWKDEIALLRSLTSQIGVIEQLSQALAGATTSALSTGTPKRKAETLQDAQQRATWDHFLDVATVAASQKPPVEPEMALLMHLLVDQHTAWNTKLDAVKTLFLARRNAAAPSLTLEKSLTAYYFELLVAAIDVCATVVEMPPAFKGAEVYLAIWRHALCGMIPELVLQLEQWLDDRQDLPLRGQRLEAPHVRLESALRAALLVMASRLDTCESAASQTNTQIGAGNDEQAAALNTNMMSDVLGIDTPPTQPVKAWLLRACIEHSLARPETIADEFSDGHKLASEVQTLTQSLRMDAQLEGLALHTLFETRISTDEPLELLDRVASDPGTHYSFARQLVMQIHGWLDQHDLESVARWCKALSEDACRGKGAMLDTIMLYIDPVQLVDPLASVLDHQEMGQTSDEPSTLSDVLLFVQLVCCRYSVPPTRISRYTITQDQPDHASASTHQAPPFLATHLAASSACPPLSTLSEDERTLVSRWIHALFGNEGISDDLIQASPPTTLLRLSPLLFSQSVSACQFGLIDLETLRGGLSYFLQDLLSFALPSALVWLLGEITRTPSQPILDFLADSGLQASVVDVPSSDGMLANGLGRNATSRTVCLEVLALLLDSEACPSSVREVVAEKWREFVCAVEGEKELGKGCETFDLGSLKARMEGVGVTARKLSGGGGWLRSLLRGSKVSGLVVGEGKLHRIVGSLGGMQGADQKAVAAWLVFCAPCDATTPPVLRFIQDLDLAALDVNSIESVIRIIGLLLGLVRASESQHDGKVPAQILRLVERRDSASDASVKPAVAEGDLFDDEPSTPPLPGTTPAPAEVNSGPSTASFLTSRDYSVTPRQLLDLTLLKLIRFKAKGVKDRTKWQAVVEAVADYLVENEGEEARGKQSGLGGWLSILQ